ncbi:RICIN domain-containing protein [Reichenbachiella agarivorans]|uniref:RICIN domain-containing protein n=1 Tax=Reichenbachiella agarivorans TaxID=2979464 RepID=A0ABY6CPP2_9BACT|nr:RICIN domain-containing protein [Reichenbachiella agarivorans]UXP32493.1 RICIN domain-containing protein [Reichenbachiella agarivorans]
MYNYYKATKGLKGLFVLALATLLIYGCNDELVLPSEELSTIVDEESAVPTAGTTYYLKSRKSGRYADVKDFSHSNGGIIHQWNYTGALNQQWEVLSVGSGQFRLKSVESGKSFDIAGSSTANKAYLQQWAYGGASNQKFTFTSAGSGYYMIKAVHSGKALDGTGQTANGTRIWQWTYNSGNQNQHWLFEEVGGSTGGGGGSSGSSYPGALLGLTTSNWKLNCFTGSPSSSTYRDDVLDYTGKTFSNYSDANYFYVDGDYAVFRVYRGQPGSSNSGNPRVELREMKNGNEAAWSGSSGNNTMTWVARIDQLGKSASGNDGVTCFGQIHGDGDTVDDVIRVQFLGSVNQSSGAVKLKISGYVTEELQGGSKTYTGYSLDTDYTFKLTYNSSTVKFYVNGSQVFSQSMSGEDTSNNYFKVGNYMQSVQGASYDGSHAIVKIKSLSFTH